MINDLINELLEYGIRNNLITKLDKIYSANLLINILKVDSFAEKDIKDVRAINEILDDLVSYAYSKKIIDNLDKSVTDLFDSALMDTLMPRPSEVCYKFNDLYQTSKIDATNYFYDLAIKSNYIRMDRINKNINFKHDSPYGRMDITINLSKPEKDPKMIAAAKLVKQSGYPKCLLCKEAMGYYGNLNYPGRTNHRIIPLSLNNKQYYLQYSPYVYYNEHCIVFNDEHVPMEISENTFKNLVNFVELFPHYFMGSNADLPIVGGSVLSHDHYQGGNYNFTMFDAKSLFDFGLIDGVSVSYVNWPLDTLKLTSTNKTTLTNLSTNILNAWRNYSNKEINLINFTTELHNTITPIVKKDGDNFVMYLVLRNNRTDDNHQYGIFHPNEKLHHVKKENIGLIEVMGLAVLPKRLKEEMEALANVLLNKNESELESNLLLKHKEWYFEIRNLHEYNAKNVKSYLEEEIGKVFVNVLEDCSVFKYGNKIDEMKKFISFLNGDKQ